MDFLSNFPGHKAIAGILLAFICIVEIYRGFLKPFPGYCTHPSKPFRFPLTFIAIAIVSALGISPFDTWLIAKVQAIQNETLLQAIRFGSFWGRSQNTWVVLGALYLGAWIIRHETTRRIFWGALLSSAFTGLIVHIMKFIFMRARPYNDLGPYDFFNWDQIGQKGAFLSFPSGDVGTAAGAAAFLFFATRRFGGAAFFLVSILVAMSRMNLDKHWPSDTFFSFWLGLAVAGFVWNYLQCFVNAGPAGTAGKAKI